MSKRSLFDPSNLRKIGAGKWVWQDGIGYRADSRGGGAWYVKYWAPVPGHYPEGVRPPLRQVKERLPNCRNRSQAEGVLMARRSAIFEGTYQPRRKAHASTLADFTPEFLTTKRHLSTVSKYRLLLEKYLVPHFGKKPLAAISNQDCVDYYNLRLDFDAAIATVNGEMACLKSLFTEAIRAGKCQANPVRGIPLLIPITYATEFCQRMRLPDYSPQPTRLPITFARYSTYFISLECGAAKRFS